MTDVFQKLNEVQSVYAYELDGQRFDVVEKFGLKIAPLCQRQFHLCKTNACPKCRIEEPQGFRDAALACLQGVLNSHTCFVHRDHLGTAGNRCPLNTSHPTSPAAPCPPHAGLLPHSKNKKSRPCVEEDSVYSRNM